jgi:energy-coupling factor transporter ATP-binding protein EcfA2
MRKHIRTLRTWIVLRLGGEAARRQRHARRLAGLLIRELTRLGFVERVGKKGSQRRIVRYEPPLLMTADELWCPLDLKRFPARRSTNDLREPDVLQSLHDRVNAPVRVDKLPNGKLCLVTRMRAAQFPASYSIDKFRLPGEAPLLAFPLGIDVDGTHQYADLETVKHLLVAGATGGGKTTFMHTMLYTFINRCTDEDIELWLIDLKGQEFGKYEKLMGTKSKPGIVRFFAHDPQHALEVLDLAVKEIKRRNQLMKQYDASNLKDLMHLSGQRLRRIVVAIDEVAVLTLDRERVAKHTVGSWAQHLITQVAALGRAAGVHAVIATQHINKDVLTGLILANFESRVCFSVADWRKSQLVIETSEADSIPTGRMIYRHLGRTIEHQAPLITPSQLRLEVTRIAQNGPDGGLGDQEEIRRFVRNAKLIVQTACDQFDGACTISKLYQAEGIRGVLSKADVEETCRRLERDGVLEPGSNRKPRRVARGFYKMPELLDSRYASVPAASQDAQDAARTQPGRSEESDQHPDDRMQRPDHTDAESSASQEPDSASCVLENPVDHAQIEHAAIQAHIAATVREIQELTDDNPELRDGLAGGPFSTLLGLESRQAPACTTTIAPSTTVYSVTYMHNGQRLSLVLTRGGHRGVAAFTTQEQAEAAARQRNLQEWRIIPDTHDKLEARAQRFALGVLLDADA